MNGTQIAIIELILFYSLYRLQLYLYTFSNLPDYSLLWCSFTILTGVWGLSYIIKHKETINIANELINKNESVWKNKYPISTILPWNLSVVFYAQYGAWTDREYKTERYRWILLVERSHFIVCAFASYGAILFDIKKDMYKFYAFIGFAMGCQLINSILYIVQYIIQVRTESSVNYNSHEFPAGILLSKRPFIYINIFWTVMPIAVLFPYMLSLSPY